MVLPRRDTAFGGILVLYYYAKTTFVLKHIPSVFLISKYLLALFIKDLYEGPATKNGSNATVLDHMVLLHIKVSARRFCQTSLRL